MHKVSVIVTVYNTEKYVEECIVSLINQTYKNIEIILVDGGSTDKTPEICHKYEKEYENIRVVLQEIEELKRQLVIIYCLLMGMIG